MKFIVRQGKRRGRGPYLAWSPLGISPPYFYHYSKRQKRAKRFDTAEQAKEAAKNVWHVTSYRVVKLKKRS